LQFLSPWWFRFFTGARWEVRHHRGLWFLLMIWLFKNIALIFFLGTEEFAYDCNRWVFLRSREYVSTRVFVDQVIGGDKLHRFWRISRFFVCSDPRLADRGVVNSFTGAFRKLRHLRLRYVIGLITWNLRFSDAWHRTHWILLSPEVLIRNVRLFLSCATCALQSNFTIHDNLRCRPTKRFLAVFLLLLKINCFQFLLVMIRTRTDLIFRSSVGNAGFNVLWFFLVSVDNLFHRWIAIRPPATPFWSLHLAVEIDS
jgi:hypothetical protein